MSGRKTDYSTGSENGMSFICNRWVFTGPQGYRVKANDDGTFRVVSYNAAEERAFGWRPEEVSLTEDAAHELAASLAKLPVHPRPVPPDPAGFALMVTRHRKSAYAESCPYAGEDDHECDSSVCLYLDGDWREIEPSRDEEFAPDADDIEAADGSPVKWAVDLLRGGKFPELYANGSPIVNVRPHDWMSGTEDDPYKDEYVEVSVRLTGDGWTDETRTAVFLGAQWS